MASKRASCAGRSGKGVVGRKLGMWERSCVPRYEAYSGGGKGKPKQQDGSFRCLSALIGAVCMDIPQLYSSVTEASCGLSEDTRGFHDWLGQKPSSFILLGQSLSQSHP